MTGDMKMDGTTERGNDSDAAHMAGRAQGSAEASADMRRRAANVVRAKTGGPNSVSPLWIEKVAAEIEALPLVEKVR